MLTVGLGREFEAVGKRSEINEADCRKREESKKYFLFLFRPVNKVNKNYYRENKSGKIMIQKHHSFDADERNHVEKITYS